MYTGLGLPPLKAVKSPILPASIHFVPARRGDGRSISTQNGAAGGQFFLVHSDCDVAGIGSAGSGVYAACRDAVGGGCSTRGARGTKDDAADTCDNE